MKALIPFSVAAALALGSAFSQENYTQWTGLRSYYLNTSVSGANVAGTVRGFPLLVRLAAADSAVFSAAKPDGADLRFTKANGTRLHHQIESWDSTGRAAAVWVLMDTVKGNTVNQQLRMHWGKTDAPDSSRGAAVFDTANGYVAVWHMTGSGDASDATANGLTAVGPPGGIPVAAAGLLGPGRSFDGTTQHFIVADNARLEITEQITMSLWVNASNWNGSTRLLQKSPAADNNSGQYGLRDDSNDMMAANLNGIHSANGLAPSPATGAWHLIHATYDGDVVSQYHDGVLIVSGILGGPINTGAGDLNIARRPDGTSFLTGMLDEVRLQKVARSADWAKLEYENQRAGQIMMTTSPIVVSVHGAVHPRAAGGFTIESAGQGLTFLFPGAPEGRSGGQAVLTLTDMRGRIVWTGAFTAGMDRLSWAGRAGNGAEVSAGIYAARLTLLNAGGEVVQVMDRKIPYAR